jgi:radical SAM superfamily enzyme YgiQ (UPF0313 family)
MWYEVVGQHQFARRLDRGQGMLSSAAPTSRRFQLALIKPSHYDDDGYVIQWMRSIIPSNTLAVLYSLFQDSATRQALGSDVAIDISVVDEITTRVRPNQIVKRFRRHGNFGLVIFAGVQTNQYPRTLDLARPLRDAGIPVAIGGFHVSGCLAMLPEVQPELQEAIDMGISLFAGELEDRCDDILRAAADGSLKPVYNFLDDLPGIQSMPVPMLPRRYLARTVQMMTSFDAGRGCPYQCSFCTIINVQGRKSRQRSADDIEKVIRANAAQQVRWFFITDDNFARNNEWEPIFDRLIRMREIDGLSPKLIIQVDALCHKIPNFIEKAARAGVKRVFIGLESINPANLLAAKKRQNKITEYRQMLLAWKATGVTTYAGYILGFPADTYDSILEDIDIIKKELPLDILEFFCLTPTPGCEDHKKLWEKGVAMDPDYNRYDAEHVCTAHPNMTREQWEKVYRKAWDIYYSPQHIETILRRGAATGTPLSNLADMLLLFSAAVPLENVHPLQCGLFRLKRRTDRRPPFPIVPAWQFYPKYVMVLILKSISYVKRGLAIHKMKRRILKDPKRNSYMDDALKPVSMQDTEVLALFTHSETARKAVQHTQKVAELTRTV